MSTIKRIMVPIDFSETSVRALGYAADIAKAMNAEMVLVNVINQRDVDAVQWLEYQDKSNVTVDEFLEKQKKERASKMDKLIGDGGFEHLKIEKTFRVGIPFLELVYAVRETGADLVVMGSKGRGNAPGVIFGTTAEKMLRRCPVPLLSIRSR